MKMAQLSEIREEFFNEIYFLNSEYDEQSGSVPGIDKISYAAAIARNKIRTIKEEVVLLISVGSLFSGIGGIELGLERTGQFKTIWFSETNDYASRVLRRHWESVPNLGDVREIDWNTIPHPNMLTGGFPCQDISSAGKKEGIEGSRSGLWKEYLRAVREIRPGLALIENVSVLTRRGLNVILADLASIGYDAGWDCIPAAAIGAPHRRDRIFIVAYSNKRRCERENLSTEHQGRRESLSSGSGSIVSDSDSQGLEGQCLSRSFGEKFTESRGDCAFIPDTNHSKTPRQRENSGSVFAFPESTGFSLGNCQEWWSVEPEVGRVADGVPARVDRLRCLGNAVVPQVAEFIGYWIIERFGIIEKRED